MFVTMMYQLVLLLNSIGREAEMSVYTYKKVV